MLEGRAGAPNAKHRLIEAPVSADKAKVMAYSPVESNRADHLLVCPDGMTLLRGITR